MKDPRTEIQKRYYQINSTGVPSGNSQPPNRFHQIDTVSRVEALEARHDSSDEGFEAMYAVDSEMDPSSYSMSSYGGQGRSNKPKPKKIPSKNNNKRKKKNKGHKGHSAGFG